jgi:Ion channel
MGTLRMTYIIAVLGFMLLLMVLWDAFEMVILPRRVTHYLGLARVFYRFTWRLWSTVAQSMRDDRRRETYLSIFGPLSLLLLLGVWATGLVAGFAMVHRGLGTPLNVGPGSVPFSTYLYMSGTTFFTLGLGDVTPLEPLGRALMVVEAGVGFGFLAAVISYLPILYQAFSRREVSIALLEARAGSPPVPGSYYGGTVRICQSSASCSMTGNAGRRSCWRAISPTPCWPTSARSTRTNRGWRR